MRLTFAGQPTPRVGVALEFQLLERSSLRPSPAASVVLEQLQEERSFLPGLYQSVISLETSLHRSVESLGLELYGLFGRLNAACEDHGLLLLASGTHPLADWRSLHLSPSPRHEAFVRRLQWVGRRAAVYGLRIRVGVPDGEKAIVLCNSISSRVPLLLALSASSPFWKGVETGLASCRTRVIDSIPNAGLPPNLMNFGEFQGYVKTLWAAESIERISDIWWDVRPNLHLGAVELQACDMPHTLSETLALTALTQAMVIWMLQRYEAGEPIPFSEPWINRENRWRATRFGMDAELVHAGDGSLIPARDLLREITHQLVDVVCKERLEGSFATLQQICDAGSGAARQRRVAQSLGLHQVACMLVDELQADRILC